MKPNPVSYKRLLVSALVSGLLLAMALALSDPASPKALTRNLGFPLVRLMGFIFLGLLTGQIIEGLGWTRKFAILTRPFFSFGNMGDHCGAAFTSAFISGATANAMLLDFYQDNKITRLQLFLANYLNQFPAYFLHLPTTLFIVLPLTGTAGALYFLLTFLATLVRTLLCLFFGRLVLPRTPYSAPKGPLNPDLAIRPSLRQVLSRIGSRLPGRLASIFVWVLPIYTLVFTLQMHGWFQAMDLALSSHIHFNFMPMESLSIIMLSFAAEFTSGFAAAGALMDAGVLTVKQTVIALLLGNILAFPLRALRHQIPRYIGIFSPRLGLQLLLSGQLFRILSLIFTGLIYYWVAP